MNQVVLLAFLLGGVNPGAAELPGRGQDEIAPNGGPVASDTKQAEKRWFLGLGTSNYHPRLKESERQIDAEINGMLGGLLPAWQRPETFKDWSKDWKIWDIWLEAGRDITPRTSWFAAVGGIAATIKNDETYFPLGLPLNSDIRFKRTVAFLTGGLTYYPYGKPSLDPVSREWNVVKRAVCRAKPYAEFGVGYTFIRAEASVKLKIPVIGQLYEQKEKSDYHLLQANPRLGVEFPLNDDDSLSVTGCYYFFNEHSSEFNGPSVSVIFKHKF